MSTVEQAGGLEHHIDDQAGILPPDAAPELPAAPSVLDGLRQRRAQLAQEGPKRLELDVPGYNGRLFVRYRYPEGGYQPVVAIYRRSQESKVRDADLLGNCDVLVMCCEAVLGRNAQGDVIDLETDQPPDSLYSSNLRFGKKLAGLFGIPVPDEIKSPGRFVVRHIFSPRAQDTGVYDGDLTLMTQGGQVLSWLNGMESDLSSEFVGE